ncbi:hypothetical protein ACEWY4_001284 [Coilia grayii]|uniref:Uncharacterized protein n=1 Tax=Coilia grayii TaxID=363190 RepID=A0ABD1KSI2_9TELE
MSVLGEEDAANVKRIDGGIKCSWKWSWLKLEGKVAVKGKELSFHIGDIFKKIDRQGLARCVLCQKDINYSNKGSHALMAHVQTDIHKRKLEVIMSTQSVASHFLPAPASQGQGSMSTSPGPETVRQQVQGKMPVPIVSRIANAEAMVLGTLAEHSIPFSMAPVIVELAQTLSLDKPALQGMKLSRTAASYKMIHGLGRTYSERTFSNMRRFSFSLNIDESTSNNNKKVLSMLVCYYHNDLHKVMVEHLGSVEILRVDAASLEKVLSDFFRDNNIPWHNLVSLLMDSCAVMRGSKTGLETRIQQYCPNLLDVDGDSCHHVHNAAKKFSEAFDGNLERLFSDLQVDHQWSPDQVMYLKEIAMMLNLPASSPQRGFVNHRWLSAYDASMATHAMMPAYQVLYYGFLSTADKELYKEPFESILTKHNVNETARARVKVVQDKLAKKGMTPQGCERKKRICQKLWHEETTTVLELSLYMGVLAILKDYVMVFQGSETLVHKLHDRQLELFLAYLACFVKAEHITKLSPKALKELVLEDHMLLHSKDIRVRKAYTTTAVYLQKKLPLNSPTLIALSALDPLLRGHSQATIQLKRLGGMLSHLLPENQDLQRELVHFNVDLTLPRYKEGDGVVEWWGHVFDQPGKYPTLSALVKCCLSIFHGPRVESSFSLMNEVLDQRSGNMNVETFNAIQTVKYTLLSRGQTAIQMFRREDVKFGEVDRMMSKNISTAAATYRQRLKAKSMDREMQQRRYGHKQMGSAQQAKKQAAETEKQARLRHAATQRKRAMETLVTLAKRRRNTIPFLSGFTQVTWNFSEKSHGKGAPDGVGGAVKRIADSAVNRGADIQTPEDFYSFLTERQASSEIKFFWVSEEDIKRHICECHNTTVVSFKTSSTPVSVKVDHDLTGKFILVKYEGQPFVGQVLRVIGEETEVTAMQQLGNRNVFTWPHPADKIFYYLTDVLEVISEPEPLNSRHSRLTDAHWDSFSRHT